MEEDTLSPWSSCTSLWLKTLPRLGRSLPRSTGARREGGEAVEEEEEEEPPWPILLGGACFWNKASMDENLLRSSFAADGCPLDKLGNPPPPPSVEAETGAGAFPLDLLRCANWTDSLSFMLCFCCALRELGSMVLDRSWRASSAAADGAPACPASVAASMFLSLSPSVLMSFQDSRLAAASPTTTLLRSNRVSLEANGGSAPL